MPNRSIDLRTAERDYGLARQHTLQMLDKKITTKSQLASAENDWDINVLNFELFQAILSIETEILDSLNAQKHVNDALKCSGDATQPISVTLPIAHTLPKIQEMMNSAMPAMYGEFERGSRDCVQLQATGREAALAANNQHDENNPLLKTISTRVITDLSLIEHITQASLRATEFNIQELNRHKVLTEETLEKIRPKISSLKASYSDRKQDFLKAQQLELAAQAELDDLQVRYDAYLLLHPDCEDFPIGFHLEIPQNAQRWDNYFAYEHAAPSGTNEAHQSDNDWAGVHGFATAVAIAVVTNENAVFWE